MASLNVANNTIEVGDLFKVSLVRTVRVPDDGRVYPLTPHLGDFEVRAASSHASRVPASWSRENGVFVPIYDGEAMWLRFTARMPHAVLVTIDSVDAVTARKSDGTLHARPQNYVVCPPQQWLDGLVVDDSQNPGRVRQFVAQPQPRDQDSARGGLTLRVYPPTPGSAAAQLRLTDQSAVQTANPFALEMSVTPRGLMHEGIEPDPFGVATWDADASTHVEIHFAEVQWFSEVTGETVPPPPPSDPIVYPR
jgi:hypothetical protein